MNTVYENAKTFSVDVSTKYGEENAIGVTAVRIADGALILEQPVYGKTSDIIGFAQGEWIMFATRTVP